MMESSIIRLNYCRLGFMSEMLLLVSVFQQEPQFNIYKGEETESILLIL